MSLKACLTPLAVPASGGSELSERKLLSTRGLQSGVKCHRHRAQSTQRHRFPWVSPELRVQPPLNPHGVWPHGGHTESAALSETPSWGKRMRHTSLPSQPKHPLLRRSRPSRSLRHSSASCFLPAGSCTTWITTRRAQQHEGSAVATPGTDRKIRLKPPLPHVSGDSLHAHRAPPPRPLDAQDWAVGPTLG